jgi:hypothetical protein
MEAVGECNELSWWVGGVSMCVSLVLTGELYRRLIGFCTRVRKKYSVRKGALNESLCELYLQVTFNISLFSFLGFGFNCIAEDRLGSHWKLTAEFIN